MPTHWRPLTVVATALVITITCFAGENVIHNFTGGIDGGYPYGTLAPDSAGNLFGVAQGGGEYGDGTVFELVNSGGTWTLLTLHSFNAAMGDGLNPIGGLIFDQQGNVYGTTSAGGANGFGTVFKVSHTSAGWTETVLYSFCAVQNSGGTCLDGSIPFAGVVMDSMGNLYGTTGTGGVPSSTCIAFFGVQGCGTVFELSPQNDGTYNETVLHSFCSAPACEDGLNPATGLVIAAGGTLLGSTSIGGDPLCGGYIVGVAPGCGILFSLTQGSNAVWSEVVIHSFDGRSGLAPGGTLVLDSEGILYGATNFGGVGCRINQGNCGHGTLFQFSTATGGFADLYDFCSQSTNFYICTDGNIPEGGGNG